MYEEVCYEKSFLKEVISRIDFISPLPGLEKSLPPKLTKVLSDHFPIIEPTEGLTHSIELNFVGAGGMQQRQTPVRIWNFYGKDREKQLSLASQYVFVSYTRYSTYEDLKEDFSSVVATLDAAFSDTRAGRFGLRYINNIEIEGVPPIEGWGEYVAPVLITPPEFFAGQQLTRLLHLAELKCGDLALRFNFGLPNPDYPSPIKRPSFILDLDAYIQAAHDLGESLQYMEKAHGCIRDLFEKSITDKLRERMHAQAAPSVQ